MKSIDIIIFLEDNRNHAEIVGYTTIKKKDEVVMKEEKPLGMEINCIANLIRREVDKSIGGIYVDDTSRSNGWIINYIAAHPERDVFQKDFEREFSLTRSTISKVVDLMVQKGLIIRSPVDYDARLKKLTLTPKAMMMYQRVQEGSEQFEHRLTDGFSEQEIRQLRQYLHRLAENLSKTV